MRPLEVAVTICGGVFNLCLSLIVNFSKGKSTYIKTEVQWRSLQNVCTHLLLLSLYLFQR